MAKNTLRSAYFYSMAGVGAVALAGITTGILSSRTLGAKGRGELTALLLLPGLVGRLGNIGMSQAVGFLDSPARNDPRQAAGAALVSGFGIGSALFVCLLPFLSLLLPNLPGDMILPAAICLLYIPLNFIYSVLLGADLAAGDFRSYNLLQVSAGAGQVIFMTIFWRMGRASATTFGVAVVLSVSIVLLARTPTLARMLSLGGITRAAAGRVLLKAWQFAQPELAGLALLRCDVLLLARMVSNEALGLYTVAMAVAFGQALIANPLAQVCFHSTSSATDRAAAIDSLARQFRFLQILFLAIAGIAIAIAPTLIRAAFGARFSASAPAARILILGMTVWSCSQILEGGLRGMDLARLCSWSNLLGLGALLASAGVLVRTFGIAGMATAMLAGQGASFAAKLFLLRRTAHCRIANFWAFSLAGLDEFRAVASLQVRHLIRRVRPGPLETVGSA